MPNRVQSWSMWELILYQNFIRKFPEAVILMINLLKTVLFEREIMRKSAPNRLKPILPSFENRRIKFRRKITPKITPNSTAENRNLMNIWIWRSTIRYQQNGKSTSLPAKVIIVIDEFLHEIIQYIFAGAQN